MKKNEIITINGVNYKLIETIGNGGSGTVWKTQFKENEYAIKFLNPGNEDKKKRFKKEIEFCKTKNHKNIIKIIDCEEINGKLCYVMPLYTQTLKDLIKNEENPNILIKFILKLCDALKYIHNKRIFHRDIKPENILIINNDLVLADFGIAHFKNSKLTSKGSLLANRNYAAPEQKDKNNNDIITEAVDIFALGLIINECFTKQTPSGSNFKLIADKYPLLYEFDDLIIKMIKQNPYERLNINSVITEIKFIHNKIKKNLEDITSIIKKQTDLNHIKKSILKKIIKKSSEDILFGKILFYSRSSEELEKYNSNWHMNIRYSVDDFLYNLYIQEQIYNKCKGKFKYESNIYESKKWYKVLDLENIEEHKLLYEQINNIVAKYKLPKNQESLYGLSGQILKYFSSCTDYHCEEILESIKEIEDLAKINLKNAPIICIVKTMKNGLKQNIDLMNDNNFNFTKYIKISLKYEENYLVNYDDNELFDNYYTEKEEELYNILSEFENKWKVIYNKLNEDYYSIKFNYKQYDKFKKYALQLSSTNYIFKNDVMNILEHQNFIGNTVELKLGKIFDIPHTIAKILGLRNIYI